MISPNADIPISDWYTGTSALFVVKLFLRGLTRCQYTKETDTHTSKKSARQHHASVLACCLQHTSNYEDNTGNDDYLSAVFLNVE